MRKDIIKNAAFFNLSLCSLGTLVTASPLGFGPWLQQINTPFIQLIAETLANLAFGALVFGIAFTSLLSLIGLYKLLYHGKKGEGRGLIVIASLLINIAYALAPSIIIFSSSLYWLAPLFILGLIIFGLGVYQRYHTFQAASEKKPSNTTDDDNLLFAEDKKATAEKAKHQGSIVRIELSQYPTSNDLRKVLLEHQHATAFDFSRQDLSQDSSKQMLAEAWKGLTFPYLEYLDLSHTCLKRFHFSLNETFADIFAIDETQSAFFPKLKYLSLSNNSLGPADLFHLRDACAHFPNIQFINMRHNQLSFIWDSDINSVNKLGRTITIDVSGNLVEPIPESVKKNIDHTLIISDRQAEVTDLTIPDSLITSTDASSELEQKSIPTITESKEHSGQIRFFAKPISRKNAFYPEVPTLISPKQWLVSVGCAEGRDHLIILLQSTSTDITLLPKKSDSGDSGDSYLLYNSVQTFDLDSTGVHVSDIRSYDLERFKKEYNFCHYPITDEQGKQLKKSIQEDYDRYNKGKLSFSLIFGLYPKLNLGHERYNCITWSQKHLSAIGITLPDTWMPTWAAKNTDLFGNLFSNPTSTIMTEAEKPYDPLVY